MGDLWADLAGAWGTATDLTMHEALDRWLDRMEVLYTHDHDQRPYRTRPIPTGLPALNRVVGGGLRCRGLTTLECEKLFQGDAVLATVARRIKTTVLLAGSHMADLTADVLVGEAQISPRDAARGTLTDEDWARISSAVGYLSDRHIRLTSVGTLAGLHSLIVDFPEVTSVLVGASSAEQLVDSLGAVQGPALSEEELALIDEHAVESGIDLWRAAREGDGSRD